MNDLLTIGGAVVGGVYGGPTGAMMGAQAGGMAGNLLNKPQEPTTTVQSGGNDRRMSAIDMMQKNNENQQKLMAGMNALENQPPEIKQYYGPMLQQAYKQSQQGRTA